MLIDEPLRFISQFTNGGANRVTIHFESSQRLPETVAPNILAIQDAIEKIEM
ncbi:hypothetical protein GF337_02015 [candidate division KSB1 bacterium]|nr:hypothetical protein [candidate division KSB1 bacterium]